MSWVVKYDSKNDFKNDIRLTDYPVIVSTDQLSTARLAADLLLKSGSLGIGKDYSFILRGHSNPEHEPVEGLPNDYITVQVIQK